MDGATDHNMEYQKFALWLDGVLEKEALDEILAFNFNLYSRENEYNIELIGSDQYNYDDSNWACSEKFTTRNKLYIVTTEVVGNELDDALKFFGRVIEQYLMQGQFKDKLLSKKAISIGFVDGDLHLIYDQEEQ